MNIKTTLLTITAIVGFAFAKAQEENAQCGQALSIFAENAKAKNYGEAYKQLNGLIENCPKISPALYQYGERIYEYRLKKKEGDQKENAQGLIDMLNAQINLYPEKTNISKKKIEIGRTMFKYKMGTQTEQFEMLNNVFTTDPKNFTDPNGMITYFKLAEKEYGASKMDLQGLFDIYDKLTSRIEELQDERSKVVSDLLDKKENEGITSAEEKTIANQEKNLKYYGLVMKSVNGTLGQLADCDKLIPLYNNEFENKKDNEKWLGDVLRRLQSKDCTDDSLYVKSVKALHVLKPSWKTAYGLGNIAATQDEKFQYWDQAIELGADKDTQTKIYYKKGEIYKKAGSYSTAKRFYIKATQTKPSFGAPYLKIAEMIGKSSNSCGATPFEKRAVNWVAARWADKAGRVDASLKSTASKAAASYRGRAPQKPEIFMEKAYNSGDSISFSCWIGESVRIP
jgi:tetratricopeptide (TPR) repeat protein